MTGLFRLVLVGALVFSFGAAQADNGDWDRDGNTGGFIPGDGSNNGDWDRGNGNDGDWDRGDRGGRGDNGDWDRGDRDGGWDRDRDHRRPPRPRPRPPGGGGDRLTDIHRFFTGFSHFWTLNMWEGQNAGFNYEGVGFRTFSNPGPGRQQVFRCYTGQTHFMSVDGNCEGQRFEGGMGFVARNPGGRARQELVRCYNGRSHLVTTNRWECHNAGYHVEGVLGYVP